METSAATSPSQPHLRLRPPRNKLDRRAPMLWALKGLIDSVILLVGVAIVTRFVPDEFQQWMTMLLGISIALAVLVTVVVPIWRYRVHRWEVTEDAVYASRGWWRQEWRIAPISRLQTIDTVRGPLQRRFGLASLTVTTASAAGPILIEGLDGEVARELSTQLTAISAQDGSDGT
jgi:membrane protein YdbS with pleckstrin-like domain